MLKQHGGHVVNISASIAAHADSVEPTALTALTKGGLAAVTKSLAVEYASCGIRVNAVAPGITQTPLLPPGRAYRTSMRRRNAPSSSAPACCAAANGGTHWPTRPATRSTCALTPAIRGPP